MMSFEEGSILGNYSNIFDIAKKNQGSKKCLTCGADNPADAIFCCECGEKLPELKTEAEVTENSSEIMKNIPGEETDATLQKVNVSDGGNIANNELVNENVPTLACPICGTVNDSEARFCEECGQELANPDESLRQNSFLDNVVGDLLGGLNNEVEETSTQAVPDITVKATDMPSEKPIEIGIQAVTANVAENLANENMLPFICPFCGTDNRSIARFCRECGRKLNKATEDVAQNDFLDNVVSDLMGDVSEKNGNLTQPLIANNTEEIEEAPIAKQNQTESVLTVSENDSFAQNDFLDNTVNELLGGSFDETTASTAEVNGKIY